MIVYREAFYAFRARVKRKDRAWWQIFTQNARFDHVAAFYYDPLFEEWQLIEWSERGLFFGRISDEELDRYVVYLSMSGGRILRYKAVEPPRMMRFPPTAWSYCVSGAKHLACIRSWALTPDQLFSALQQCGAHAAFTSVLDDGDEADGISSPEPAADTGT